MLVPSAEPIYLRLAFAVAVLGGATASIAGSGIGSTLTPLMAPRPGVPVAVAAVAIPGAIAPFRAWRLPQRVRKVIGVLSARSA